MMMSDPVAPERAYGYVSPHNFSAPVRNQMNLPGKVILNDLTLREGRGVDGVALELPEIQQIALILAELGVPMIQLLGDNVAELKAVHALKLDIEIEVLISSPYQRPPYTVEAHRKKMDEVMELGMRLDLCFGSSDHLLLGRRDLRGGKESIEELREKELSVALEQVRYAKAQGAIVGINVQDFLRADLDFLRRFCKSLATVGADLLTLDDFAGPAIPAVYKYVVQTLKQEISQVPFGIHVTNDFGLGTALVLAAFEGGAEVLDVGINNYGERTGHADLAGMAVALEVFYGKSTGIKLDKLYETSKTVSSIFRVPISPYKPLVGDKAFADVGEVHYQYLTQPWIFRAIPASLVGNRRRVALGDKSGPNAIKAKAAELGIPIEENMVGSIQAKVLEIIRSQKRPLKDEEFIAIAEASR